MSGRRSLPLVATAFAVALIAGACGSSPAATPTPAPAGTVAPAGTSAPPAASEPAGPGASLALGVTVDGATVTIVGQGRGDSDPFELPAGSATMTITACQSNGVMPIITLVDSTGSNAGLIVDPEKVLNNLKGGTYHIAAQANPGCLWQVRLTPG